MPRAQIRFDPRGQGGIGDALVELEKVRMSSPDAEPDDFGAAFGGESPEAVERKKEARKANRAQLHLELLFCLRRDLAQKSEREMQLRGADPADAGPPGI